MIYEDALVLHAIYTQRTDTIIDLVLVLHAQGPLNSKELHFENYVALD